MPAQIDTLTSLQFDELAYQIAIKHQFEPIELSPLGPLGNCSVLATVHQNKVVTTIRNTKVMADPDQYHGFGMC